MSYGIRFRDVLGEWSWYGGRVWYEGKVRGRLVRADFEQATFIHDLPTAEKLADRFRAEHPEFTLRVVLALDADELAELVDARADWIDWLTQEDGSLHAQAMPLTAPDPRTDYVDVPKGSATATLDGAFSADDLLALALHMLAHKVQ